jgi:hypothetical protein
LPLSSELDQLRVVLVDVRNPLNIGASARAMSNFGFRHLRVVNPYDVAFEGARSAVGAADVLASAEKYQTSRKRLRIARWSLELLRSGRAICSILCSVWKRAHRLFVRIFLLLPRLAALARSCSVRKNTGSLIRI